MSIAKTFLDEFEAETRTTRKFVERLPTDKLGWQPHPKSMTAGQLGYHIAEAPGQVVQMAVLEEYTPSFGRGNPQPASTQEIMDKFEESVATVRKVLPAITDEQMHGTWKLLKDGKPLLAIPRAVVLRNILLNHWYHHRGQIGVYLRLLGCKVPSSYGPSGDEAPDFMQ